MAMAHSIQVDIAALRRLGADLAGLARQLEADNDDPTCIGTWVSDPRIRTALEDVQHDWSHKRNAFTGYLRDVGRTVQQVAEGYDGVEHQITRAAR